MPVNAARVLRVVSGNEGPSDADLLGRFIDRRDEGAFALLVHRHGAMVHGVCRRLLPTDQDAEDAFQATFLVLSEKARTIVPREAVGNWLYEVARRAALLARRSIARRKERTGDVPERPAPRSDELRALLDEELSRLPAAYRTVIVLCDLEGRTRREAAAVLGWPEGTVAGRLVRGRELLAKRLAPAVSIAAVLAGTASARVPEVLPRSAIPARAAALTREVTSDMMRGKLMKTAAVALLLVGAGLGMVLHARQTEAPQSAPALPATTAAGEKPAGKDVVAWGQEVDGLQAGLVLKEIACLPGETLHAEVRLRNVGKTDITVTHGLLRESPPRVVVADGVVMPVKTPLPLGIKVRLMEKVLKPGETVTLCHPELAVEPEDRARRHGEMQVQTPTISVGPGKYGLSFHGMLVSHPTASTGDVEFEVPPVVWGKEIGGLQAGVGLVDAAPIRPGAKVQFVVQLRNVGTEAVTVSARPLWTMGPKVVDSRGQPVRSTTPPVPDFEIAPTKLTLKPGQTVLVEKTNIFVADAGAEDKPFPEGVVDRFTIHVRPGVYRAAFSGFLQERPTVATGDVGFEVKAPVRDGLRPAAGKPATEAGLPRGKFRITRQDIIQTDDVLVSQVVIDAHPGATLRVTTDTPNRGGVRAAVPTEPGQTKPVKLTILADHVKWEAGRVDALKFRLRLGGTTMQDTGAMPPNTEVLPDVVAVTAKDSLHAEGEAVPVVTFKGIEYKLVVEGPSR